MPSIVICEGCSSAALYVEEAFLRGYDIIVVNPSQSKRSFNIYRELFKDSTGDKAEFIEVKDESDYESLIERLRKSDVVAVVAGSEYGVSYADRIAKDLNLNGNDPETTYLRISKYGMYEALKKAGIRRIETAIVKNEEDIDRFWDDNRIENAFMKLNVSASSFGNKLCKTREESKEYFRSMPKSSNLWGDDSEILIQEYIDGTEYIVNTVSCNGRHYITDIWKSIKITTDDGRSIFVACTVVMSAEAGIQELVNYAFKVLDATGFKFGPCHGEYKIDKKGPVLIETNARPMGANMRSKYLDECLGHHITDIALNAYIVPRYFDAAGDKLYRPKAMGAMVMLAIPKDMDADLTPLEIIMKHMKTYRSCEPPIVRGLKHYEKTIDLETSPHTVKLCGCENDVRKDINILQTLEFQYSELIYSVPTEIKEARQDMALEKEICQFFDRINKVLVVTNNGAKASHGGKLTEVTEKHEVYDGCIFAKTDGASLSERFDNLISSVSVVRNGGAIFVLPGVYENMPYGPAGIELIMETLNIRLEVPLQSFRGVIYGTKQ